MAPLVDALQWVGVQLLTGAAGVVVGVFLRTLLPDQTRNRIVYWGNRVKKYWKNDNYHIQMAWRYTTEEPVPTEDLLDQIQSSLQVSPNSHNRFELEKEYSTEPVRVEISPSFSGGVGDHGELELMRNSVDSILITYEAAPSYRNLTEGLLDLQDADNEVGDEILSLNFTRQSSAATCDIPVQPTLQKLLGDGRLSTLRGESDDGTEVDFSSNTIQIESPESAAMSSMMKRAIVHYA